MAITSFTTSPTSWNPLLKTIIRQVEDHPAFYPQSNVNEAKKLLIGASPLTYILWKDDQNHRYYLSFMNPSLEIEHQFFTLNAGTWSYQNGDPHRVLSIELLIPIIMHCKQAQCKMLIRKTSADNC